MEDNSGIFDEVHEFPDSAAMRRYHGLVGVDEIKDRLLKESTILVDPTSLELWSKKHHGARLAILDNYARRPPLFIFHGDVGTGKTALAESFGDALARQTKLPAYLFSLSLTSRGTGAVGEMTTLVSGAFAQIRQRAKKSASSGRPNAVYILMIDEADALAQSRELAQMHHEDRAGVNAIIRGIDDIAENHLPVVVIMCTNRLSAIDPAVKRRAAADFHFERPNDERRRQIIAGALEGAGFKHDTISSLVRLTGPNEGREYGHSYSDLTHRLLPALVLDAYPDRGLDGARAIEIASRILPTPKFEEL
jgi:hypothetical protein